MASSVRSAQPARVRRGLAEKIMQILYDSLRILVENLYYR